MDFEGWKKFVLRISSAALLVVCLVHCKSEEQPKGLLSEQEMVDLMVEVYLAEARIANAQIPRDSAIRLFYHYEDSLKSRKGMADSTLKANYEYYLLHPEKMEGILDAVIDTLNLREQRFKDQL